MADKKAKKVETYDTVGNIMAFESGELGDYETVELFVQLGNNGMVYNLQGSYGRGMNALLNQGHITKRTAVYEKGKLVKVEYVNNFPKPLTIQ